MAYTSIDKPSDYFNTVLYTGNGSTQSITGVGFQPDFVWIKGRSVVAGHNLHDIVRGVNKQLYTNTTDAEETLTTLVTSFDSDGFSLGSNGNANSNTNTFVAWNWLANNTSGSSNTDGSITSSVSANTTAGFSIVTYTSNGSASQTVGHGLGVAPNVIISKNRDDGGSTYGNWIVYHSSLSNANDTKILLNSTAASSTTNEWGDTDPTSTVYSVHTSGDGATNVSTNKIVSYCFAEKKGFSKIGSYIGNGSSDGAFIYTGFKPAFILGKNASGTSAASENWFIYDNKRNTFNPTYNVAFPNNGNVEGTNSAQNIAFVSNGIKITSYDTRYNESGSTYIYMAFAENPFVTSTGVPATAR